MKKTKRNEKGWWAEFNTKRHARILERIINDLLYLYWCLDLRVDTIIMPPEFKKLLGLVVDNSQLINSVDVYVNEGEVIRICSNTARHFEAVIKTR